MPVINLTVKCSNDQKYAVEIDTAKTVLEFKQVIAEKSQTPVERQRLIYSGKVLKDADTLEIYKIAEGHTVHMVKGSSPSASSSQSQTSGQQTGNTPAATTQQPASQVPPVNPFAALGGLGANPLSPFGVYAGGTNPMDALLQNPALFQYMSQVMRDPQLMESMIAVSPQLSAMAPHIRQTMQNPEFQAMMSNPEALRQMTALFGSLGPVIGTGGMNDFGAFGTTAPPTNTTTPTTRAPDSNTQTTTTPSTTTPPVTNTTSTTSNTSTTTGTTAPVNPFLSLLNPNAATAPGGGTNPIPPVNNPLLDQLLWAGLGGAVPPTTAAPQQPPEERFQVQLQQLNEMGFWDAQQNIRALLACGGNVNAAIELLLAGDF